MGVLILLIYFSVAWYTHGRDPKRGVIIPLFAPPENFSPAAVRFVHRMAYDRKSYAASLVNMAVKGYLKISEAHGTYTLTRTGKSEGEAGLARGEAAIANKLFSIWQNSIELKQDNHGRFRASIIALEDRPSRTNMSASTSSPTAPGSSAGSRSSASPRSQRRCFATMRRPPASCCSGCQAGRSARRFCCIVPMTLGERGRRTRLAHPQHFIGALFMTAFALPFTGGLLFGLFVLAKAIAPLAALALVAGGIASYVFYHLLKAPTLAGAKIFDQIDGFRLFLVTAEKDRLEALIRRRSRLRCSRSFCPTPSRSIARTSGARNSKPKLRRREGRPVRHHGYSYTPLWYSGTSFNRLGAAGFHHRARRLDGIRRRIGSDRAGIKLGQRRRRLFRRRRRWWRRRRLVKLVAEVI